MKKFIIALVAAIGVVGVVAAETGADLKQSGEIIGLLRARYVDGAQLDEKRVSDASVAGLLKLLGSGAKILSADEAKKPVAPVEPKTKAGQPLARAEIIEPNIGYIRLADVEAAAAAEVDAALTRFAVARVVEYVLDLRFADGTNYAAAATLAGRFLRESPEVFSIKRAGKATEPFRVDAAGKPSSLSGKLVDAPLMILVNAQTRGAAEALAGALRAQDRGIVIGAATAGNALSWDDVALSDGRVLRVATAKVALPKGEIFPGGVTPDVPVKIDAQIEEDAVLHAATNVTLTASLKIEQGHKMMREADLVKYHRGEALNLPEPDSTSKTNKNNDASAKENGKNGKDNGAARDVVLQRAVDILKGIRVLLSWR